MRGDPARPRWQWSVHDVAPDTLPEVAALLDRLAAAGVGAVQLLVIPGLAWQPAAIAQLKAWQAQGHELAAHGWRHAATSRRTLWHRVHGWLLSRDAAEHLSLPPAELEALVQQSIAWFADAGLGRPRFYVPPAWALGAISARRLAAFGIDQVETLGGVTDTRSGRLALSFVVGFEADTPFRAGFLRCSNAACRVLAKLANLPLRVAIHPHDGRLLLADSLDDWLAMARAGDQHT